MLQLLRLDNGAIENAACCDEYKKRRAFHPIEENPFAMNADRYVALCCTILGLAISASSYQIGLGNIKAPDAGLFPFLIGLVIILLGLMLFREGKKPREDIPIFGERWKKLSFVVGILLCYALALDWLGFTLTTLLFMILILKAIEPQKWSVAIFTAVLSTGLGYLLFSVWLKVELPRGILGL